MKTWTEVEQRSAAAEGWRLADTIDNGEKHVYAMVSPTDGRFKNSEQAAQFVIGRAQQGSTTHQHALRLTILSRLRPPKKRAR